MISFVIPAHNEAELLGRTLVAIHESAQAAGEPYEAIVADDASLDGTGVLAKKHGARVIEVNFRQIAATRNAGARMATGDLLFFVDADTIVTVPVVRAAIGAGGGSAVRFDGPVPLYAAILERVVLPVLLPLLKMAPGCFLFCTRRAYLAAGGFDERLFWSEEVAFGKRLKRLGRFVMLRDFVITSGRKLRTRSALGLLRVGAQLALGQRAGLDYWYGPHVGEATRAPNLVVRSLDHSPMSATHMQTKSLNLIPLKREEVLARVEKMSPAEKAQLSADWLARLHDSTSADPWTYGFSLVHRGTGIAIGRCGYKGPPAADGVVEIAYGVDPDHQGKGYATEAAEALVIFAFGSGRVRVVRAHTLPEANASTRVLTKCRFRYAGEVIDPEDGLVWRWEKHREEGP